MCYLRCKRCLWMFLVAGDFNFHNNRANNTDVSGLGNLLHDNRLQRAIEEPTHPHGHTLDWLVVREDRTLQQAEVLDLVLADHKAVFCELSFDRSKRRKRSITLVG